MTNSESVSRSLPVTSLKGGDLLVWGELADSYPGFRRTEVLLLRSGREVRVSPDELVEVFN